MISWYLVSKSNPADPPQVLGGLRHWFAQRSLQQHCPEWRHKLRIEPNTSKYHDAPRFSFSMFLSCKMFRRKYNVPWHCWTIRIGAEGLSPALLLTLLWRLHKTQVVPGLGASKDQRQSSGESSQKVATVALVRHFLNQSKPTSKSVVLCWSSTFHLQSWFLTVPVWIPGRSYFGCNFSVQGKKGTAGRWWHIIVI